MESLPTPVVTYRRSRTRARTHQVAALGLLHVVPTRRAALSNLGEELARGRVGICVGSGGTHVLLRVLARDQRLAARAYERSCRLRGGCHTRSVAISGRLAHQGSCRVKVVAVLGWLPFKDGCRIWVVVL